MTKVSTMKPFAPGDIFLGCTYLCDPDDDHAGDGRILQFSRDLVPKGTLYTEGTTHLVVNLRFGPDGTLWAFDPFARTVVRVGPEGVQLPPGDFDDRAWGSVAFSGDGSFVLCEYLCGDQPYQGGMMRRLPGTEVVGYGRLAKFAADGRKVGEFDNDLSPSRTGFHGVTHCAMHPDGRTLAYMTDLGARVMRFDVHAGEQLADLLQVPEDELAQRLWTTGVDYLSDGTLLLLRGSRIDCIDGDSNKTRQIPLDEYGYAMITVAPDEATVLATNIFTGVMSRVDLASGAITGQIDTGMAKPCRSLAGVAQYPG
ncbi:MAG: hypothetical protein JSV45_15350 [Chromatiales bacterium]|nr:MAG: hypothetical protein JSV45_15350 [Chromatiales bacterium]